MTRPVVTLLSDFGLQDTFVGQMKAVILGYCPDVVLVDLTHEVPPQSVITGAIHLRSAWHWFPENTIHVVVVDPGVGSSRRAIGIRHQGHLFVGPDNGVLSGALDGAVPEEAIRLTHGGPDNGDVSRTFHGRDVFAVAAGKLAAGYVLAEIGNAFDPRETLQLTIPIPEVKGRRIRGEVLVIDRYGNAVTNIPATAFGDQSRAWSVVCGEFRVGRLSTTYAEVDEGAPLAAISSMDTVELGVRNGSAAARYDLVQGMVVDMQRSGDQ